MSKVEETLTTEATILERVANLEGRLDTEQRSLTRQFGQWMALLALIISIAVGAFQVYENTVIRERENVAKDRETLAGYVQQITELNSRVISAYYSDPNKVASQALTKTFNIEKVSILGLADNLLSKRKEIVSYASLFILSSEHLNWGNTKRAREYAELALSLATTDVERVEAKRIEARTWFAPGKSQSIARARDIFGSAIQIIESTEVLSKASMLSNVYGDWIGSEAAFGECNVAKETWRKFTDAVRNEYDGRQILNAMKSQIFAMVRNFERCQIF